MDNKQKNISLSYGIHRTPSLGADGELSDCVNLIPKNGELVNIAEPQQVEGIELPAGAVLMCVHHIVNRSVSIKNYIVKNEGNIYVVSAQNQTALLYSSEEDWVEKALTMGNMLILLGSSLENDMLYYRWGEDSYIFQNSRVPFIPIQFCLRNTNVRAEDEDEDEDLPLSRITELGKFESAVNLSGLQGLLNGTLTRVGPGTINHKKAGQDEITGSIAKLLDKVASQNRFALPFFVRYAIRLWDNTLVNWSPLVLLVPSKYPEIALIDGHKKNLGGQVMYDYLSYAVVVQTAELTCHIVAEDIEEDISPWEDLIKGISIFVSPPIYLYDPQTPPNWIRKWNDISQLRIFGAGDLAEGVYGRYEAPIGFYAYPFEAGQPDETESDDPYRPYGDTFFYDNGDINHGRALFQMSYEDAALKNMKEAVLDRADTLYHVADIPFDTLKTVYDNKRYGIMQISINEGALSALTSQEAAKVPVDTSQMSFANGLVYNRRAIFYDTKIKPGFLNMNSAVFFPYCLQGGYNKGEVRIKLKYDSNKEVVCPSSDWNRVDDTADPLNDGHPIQVHYNSINVSAAVWLHVPDGRAMNMSVGLRDINGDIQWIKSVKLEKRELLLGKYWFSNFTFNGNQADTFPALSPVEDYTEYVNNEIYYSKTGDPWSVSLTRSLPLDVEKIINVSTIFKALSPGQFGQFDLYAFTDSGIYSIAVDNEGALSTAKAISSDVCDYPNGICLTDAGVIFSTAQGLKYIKGSETRLLSRNIEGFNPDDRPYKLPTGHTLAPCNDLLDAADNRDFVAMIQDADTRVLYDYAQQLIHIFTGNAKHYVYSLETDEWSQQLFTVNGQAMPTAVVPTYPLSVMQFGQQLYEYTGEKVSNPGDPTFLKYGVAITRPICLEDPITMTAIMDLRLTGQRTNQGALRRIALWGSRDGYRWHPIRSLKAGSYKYFRFVIYSCMTDYDTLSGLSVTYQPRRTHKLR